MNQDELLAQYEQKKHDLLAANDDYLATHKRAHELFERAIAAGKTYADRDLIWAETRRKAAIVDQIDRELAEIRQRVTTG